MNNYFWNGHELQNFIFEGFSTHTLSGFISVFVSLVSVGILYEGVFTLKRNLLEKYLEIRRKLRASELLQSQGGSSFPNDGEDDDTAEEDGSISNPRHSLINDQRFSSVTDSFTLRISPVTLLAQYLNRHESVYLLVSSVLHAFYVFTSYTLMNAVMTFNIWVLVAICMGMGVGYWFFRAEGSSSSSGCKNSIEACSQSQGIDKTEVVVTDRVSPSSGKGRSSGAGNSSAHQSPSSAGRSSNSRKRHSDLRSETDPPTSQVIIVGADVHCQDKQSV